MYLCAHMLRVRNFEPQKKLSLCQPSCVLVHTDSFSMRGTVMSHFTCMSSVTSRLPNSGLSLCGCSIVVASADRNSTGSNSSSRHITPNSWRAGMPTFITDIQKTRAQQIVITPDTLSVDLTDGRTIAV